MYTSMETNEKYCFSSQNTFFHPQKYFFLSQEVGIYALVMVEYSVNFSFQLNVLGKMFALYCMMGALIFLDTVKFINEWEGGNLLLSLLSTKLIISNFLFCWY